MADTQTSKMTITGCWPRTQTFFSSILSDLKSFTKIQALLLFCFGALMVVFSVIDFNYIFDINEAEHLLVWDNDEALGFSKEKRIIMTVSGAASFTGAMAVVLTSKKKLSSYFWGIINTILYGMFAWAYGYIGDAQLNLLFFLPFQFVGIHAWLDHRDDEENAIPKSLNWWQWLVALVLAAGLTVGFYYEIPAVSKAIEDYYAFEDDWWPHFLDATTNALSIVAQFLLILRYREQWIFWGVIDVIQIAMFAGVAGFGVSFNIVSMWSLFLLNVFYGAYVWYTSDLESDTQSRKVNPV